MPIRHLAPLRLRRWVREREAERERTRALGRGINALKRDPRGSDAVWRDLVTGWGGWAASPELLEAVARAARDETRPILECGSGLTTLVLATVTKNTGFQVWSLEHDPYWYQVTAQALRDFDLEANVCLAPIRDYGEFDWYDVDKERLPHFSLVVCDGPPNSTRGGRYGLLPVIGDLLTPDCTVLLDDADRPGEQELLRRWVDENSLTYEVQGDQRPFAVVTPPRSKPRADRRRRSLLAPGQPLRHEPPRIRHRIGRRVQTNVALVLTGLASFALTAAAVEVLTDRDWQLSGFEWPGDFLTATLLVCLVPIVLRVGQLLLRPHGQRRGGRDAQDSRQGS